jgi:hypothetical protein
MGNNRIGLAAAKGTDGSIQGVSASYETSSASHLAPTFMTLLFVICFAFL